MLESLLNMCTYEDMRTFVQCIAQPSNMTKLIREMKADGVCFTQEIKNKDNVLDFSFSANLTPSVMPNKSELCYRKLVWVMKTNPIISIKIQQLIGMFEE